MGFSDCSLMIEKYLNDSISRPYLEEYVLNGLSPDNEKKDKSDK